MDKLLEALVPLQADNPLGLPIIRINSGKYDHYGIKLRKETQFSNLRQSNQGAGVNGNRERLAPMSGTIAHRALLLEPVERLRFTHKVFRGVSSDRYLCLRHPFNQLCTANAQQLRPLRLGQIPVLHQLQHQYLASLLLTQRHAGG